MVVNAFVGSSGTGKSHRAMWVAQENGIEAIIDDGLLIKGNRIIAGKSAKREKTKIASVRRAIFTDKEHVAEVKSAIEKSNLKSIMVIGTSDEMVKLIANTLGLPEITKTIYITDIATKEEIEKAKSVREIQGKHVIPVPTFEVKKDFSGYFVDSLKVIFKRGRIDPFVADKTVVRPTFSYLGDYTLSTSVIISICKHEAIKQGAEVRDVRVDDSHSGIRVEMDIILKLGDILREKSQLVQTKVSEALEQYTALAVSRIDIRVISLKK